MRCRGIYLGSVKESKDEEIKDLNILEKNTKCLIDLTNGSLEIYQGNVNDDGISEITVFDDAFGFDFSPGYNTIFLRRKIVTETFLIFNRIFYFIDFIIEYPEQNVKNIISFKLKKSDGEKFMQELRSYTNYQIIN